MGSNSFIPDWYCSQPFSQPHNRLHLNLLAFKRVAAAASQRKTKSFLFTQTSSPQFLYPIFMLLKIQTGLMQCKKNMMLKLQPAHEKLLYVPLTLTLCALCGFFVISLMQVNIFLARRRVLLLLIVMRHSAPWSNLQQFEPSWSTLTMWVLSISLKTRSNTNEPNTSRSTSILFVNVLLSAKKEFCMSHPAHQYKSWWSSPAWPITAHDSLMVGASLLDKDKHVHWPTTLMRRKKRRRNLSNKNLSWCCCIYLNLPLYGSNSG